jgi:hypothetical protein
LLFAIKNPHYSLLFLIIVIDDFIICIDYIVFVLFSSGLLLCALLAGSLLLCLLSLLCLLVQVFGQFMQRSEHLHQL